MVHERAEGKEGGGGVVLAVKRQKGSRETSWEGETFVKGGSQGTGKEYYKGKHVRAESRFSLSHRGADLGTKDGVTVETQGGGTILPRSRPTFEEPLRSRRGVQKSRGERQFQRY